MDDLIALRKHIAAINNQVVEVNSSLQSYSDEIKKNPVLLQKKMAELKQSVKQQPKQEELKKEVKPEVNKEEPTKRKEEIEDYNITDLWGDPRYNPYFLKTAEYFGLQEKEYPHAYSKINAIIDWAANNTKSKKMGDIIGQIGSTLRKLQSPGFSERRYAILYRYIKLSNEAQKVRSPQIKGEIKKEMKGYEK